MENGRVEMISIFEGEIDPKNIPKFTTHLKINE